MIQLAKARLQSLASRVEFVIGDFRNLQTLAPGGNKVDVVFSAYALGGWFVNADLIIADSPELESPLQEMRVAGIVDRAKNSDNRFPVLASTHQFLANLDKNESDQPLTLAEDLALLRSSGLKHVSAFWLEYREILYGGQK